MANVFEATSARRALAPAHRYIAICAKKRAGMREGVRDPRATRGRLAEERGRSLALVRSGGRTEGRESGARDFCMSDVTCILSQIEQGDHQAAEKLLPLIYNELRKLAAVKLAEERPGQTLQATAL